MAATLLDGAAIAHQVYTQIRERIHRLHARGVQPGLAAVLIGENAASRLPALLAQLPSLCALCAWKSPRYQRLSVDSGSFAKPRGGAPSRSNLIFAVYVECDVLRILGMPSISFHVPAIIGPGREEGVA